MTAPHPATADIPPPSLVPVQGWHCSHFFYRWNRAILNPLLKGWSNADRESAIEEFCSAMEPSESVCPERFQTFIVSGHKADFGTVMMSPDPLRLDHVHQTFLSTALGAAIEATYSFVSVSEVSEYLPTKKQYEEKLLRGGEQADAPTYQAKVAAYEKRLPMMLAQRLAPEFPQWPALCFYPMNKSRNVGANWFLLPFSSRTEMMAEHAQSGMAFGGKVTQLVTTSVGLDDWEWGVTLWAKNPQYLKDIVYTMRFDQASARFGEFGPFYTGYRATAKQILAHCCLIPAEPLAP